ncbi:MAG TPA: peptidylprolyl isomerase [Moraxellaceae bacterium]
MLPRLLLIPLLLAPLSLDVQASVRHDLNTPGLAATLDGAPFPDTVVNVMQKLAQRANPQATKAEVVQALVDDRLLGAYARQQYSVAELMEDNKVGYHPEMQLQQSLVSALQAAFGPQLSAAVKAEKNGNLTGVLTQQHEPTAADWDAVLGKPKMLLEYALDDKGRAAAAKVVVFAYRFDSKTRGQVTLRDIYDAQNVQGRNQLHARDTGFAMAQARQLLEQRYVLHWAEYRSPLGRDGYAVFRRAIEDRLLRDGWMALIGVSSDIHDDTENLKRLAAAVTTEEVHSYYEKHRDEFRRVEKVKARHIRLPDEAAASAAYARLQKGEDFAAVATAVSQAADAAQGGDMGWLLHGQKQASWLESLAFVQPAGVVSKPFRSPGRPGDNPAWEILKVEERVEGFQPEDSTEVRYVASQAIARQKALQEYRGTLDKLRAAADLRLHPSLSPMARQPAKGSGA